MKTLQEVIMSMLVESGLSEEDEATQQLAGGLHNLFEFEWQRVEVTARINEVEEAVKMKNKKLVGETIITDFAGAQQIDPNIMQLRLQGLRRMQSQMRKGK